MTALSSAALLLVPLVACSASDPQSASAQTPEDSGADGGGSVATGDASSADTGSLSAIDAESGDDARGHEGGDAEAKADASVPAARIALGILPDYDNAKSSTGGIAGFVARTGVVPAVVANYENISSGTFNTASVKGFVDEALAAGVPTISISLATGDSDVPSGPQSQIADAVAYGVSKEVTVLVRFGYEMNGNWSPSYHGGDPTIFKKTWAQVATAVHGAGGKMVWSPNIVGGDVSAYASVLPTDTSTIDVVGLDFYHFNASATNLAIGSGEIDNAIGTIYPIVDQLQKPFVLTETAVSYFDASGTWPAETDAEVAEKKAWLDLLVSSALLAKYPLYGGFVWFDYNKHESSEYRNFSISQQSHEAAMFTKWVAAETGTIGLGKP